jgi:hypothetical protein
MSYRSIIFSIYLFFALPILAQKPEIPLAINPKIAPPILQGHFKGSLSDYRILIRDSINIETWGYKNLSRISWERTDFPRVIIVHDIGYDDFVRLVNHQDISYIDIPNRLAVDERILDSLDLSLNQISSAHIQFPSITGKNLVISIKDGPFDTADIDFYHRVKHPEKITATLSSHATAMATIAAGAGNSGKNGLGAAPGAFIVSTSNNSLLPEEPSVLLNESVSVQNHSYGVGEPENYYGIESQYYDEQCNELPQILHVFSSGNSGDKDGADGEYANIKGYANITGQFKTSKNTLCVGSVGRYNQIIGLSSKGPAYDGRIKPEVVAFGADGTSDAAALVSGVAILIQDAFSQKYNTLPPASLVKATLINTARDVGSQNVDYSTGFGSINANGAISTILEKRFILDTIRQDEIKEYNLEIPENISKTKITIAWNDPSAPAGKDKALVNDIDLEVFQPSDNKTFLPWVLTPVPILDSLVALPRRKVDTLNNVEQITITAPDSGNYQIIIRGKNIGAPQEFALAYENIHQGVEWVFPFSADKLITDEQIVLRWAWYGSPETCKLEYRKTNTADWQTIDTEIDLTQGYQKWHTPDINCRIQFRMSSDSLIYLSDTIIVSKAISPETGFNCPKEIMLYWPAVKGVIGYDLWNLKNMEFEKMTRIPDTLIVLPKSEGLSKFYSVSPVFENFDGRRGISINYENQGTGCYIKTFFAEKKVTADTVHLKLELATSYLLKSITLERLYDRDFENIKAISPVKSETIVFKDIAPNKDRNVYRIKLEKENGELIYSQEESVFYSEPEQILVYPNPAIAPDYIYFIEQDELSVVSLYNLSGQLIKKHSSVSGQIKQLEIGSIQSGIYILETINNLGKKKHAKVIIAR